MDKDNKKYTVEENIQNDFELVNDEDVNTNSKGQKLKENLKKIFTKKTLQEKFPNPDTELEIPEYLPSTQSEDTILRVENLHISFRTPNGIVRAVRGVNFDLKRVRHYVSLVNQVLVSLLQVGLLWVFLQVIQLLMQDTFTMMVKI